MFKLANGFMLILFSSFLFNYLNMPYFDRVAMRCFVLDVRRDVIRFISRENFVARFRLFRDGGAQIGMRPMVLTQASWI